MNHGRATASPRHFSMSPGTAARESALPSPKQSGEWFINHGIFLKTQRPSPACWGRTPRRSHRAFWGRWTPCAALPEGSRVFFGAEPPPYGPSKGWCPPGTRHGSQSLLAAPKGAGCSGGGLGSVLPPRGAAARHHAQRALLGGFFAFCRRSRSIPLIAVNYFGINGDVLCTSPINEASRMNALANISW